MRSTTLFALSIHKLSMPYHGLLAWAHMTGPVIHCALEASHASTDIAGCVVAGDSNLYQVNGRLLFVPMSEAGLHVIPASLRSLQTDMWNSWGPFAEGSRITCWTMYSRAQPKR